jgi:hypothetical protein
VFSIKRAKVMGETSNANRIQSETASFQSLNGEKSLLTRYDSSFSWFNYERLEHLCQKCYEPALNFNDSIRLLARFYYSIPCAFSL